MFGNMHNQGALRGRIFKRKGSKSVGIEAYDSIDEKGEPIRMMKGIRRGRVTARPRNDGFDDLRISLARIKRSNRCIRNKDLLSRGGFKQDALVS